MNVKEWPAPRKSPDPTPPPTPEPNRRQRRADKSARLGVSTKRGPNAKHVHTKGKP